MQYKQHRALPPDWSHDFHGRGCPYLPLGLRMGQTAVVEAGVGRDPDPTLRLIDGLGEEHPQTCLLFGIRIAAGATFGKT